MKTYLSVKLPEVDIVKAMGARYNMGLRQWYVPDGIDNAPFKKWFVTNGLSFECRKRIAMEKWKESKK